MGDKLTSLGAGDRKAHAIDDVVKTRFQLAKQVLTGIALLCRCLDVILVELALKQAINALDLLLLAQLYAVVGQATLAGSAMLSRLLFQLALRIDRACRALEAEISAFAPGQLAGGSDITSHFGIL